MSKLPVVIAIVGIAIYLLSVYMKPGICESKDRLDGKIAIVTGGNNGIGFETVRDFLSRGAKVYIACRSVEKGEAAAKELKKTPGVTDSNVVVLHLELSSFQSIRKFAEEFHKREKQLHILVNNAGTAFRERTLTVDGFEEQFAVNHLGHFLLTNLLMDLLVASKPSRVVTVSSLAHRKGEINLDDINLEKDYGGHKAYQRSKLANVLFSNELGRILQGKGVTTYSLHPGIIFTDIGRNFLPPITTNEYGYRIVEFLSSAVNKNVWEGAQTTICCAVDSKLEHVTGKYYSDCEEVEPVAAALDVDLARRLWDVSVKLVKLQDSEIHPLLKSAA